MTKTHELAPRSLPLKLCIMGAASSPHVLARARVFDQLGHSVHLISPTSGPADNSLKVSYTSFGRGVVGKIKSLLTTYWILVRSDADLFHAHYAAEYGTWIVALMRKCPFVVTVMGGDVLFDEQGTQGHLGRWLTGFSLRRADLVTAKSHSLANRLMEMGVSKEKIKIVYWGVEPEIFSFSEEGRSKVREEWGVEEGQKVLYCPRMLQSLYNQHLLVEALPTILKEHSQTVLVLSTMGENEVYGQKVRGRVQELKLQSRVRFVSGVPREQMAGVYSAADLIIAIPSSDGMPQSTLESMACGRPVLMSNLERYKELFKHGESAWFCDLDAEKITDAVCHLLQDQEGTADMANAGHETVWSCANFNNEARRVEEFYHKLVERKAK
ncbi:glycosyltransferase [Kiloniella sp.]|uniref:glycosyltransferase n=1 Tax=Kiloniella sp. TaxID=1938587 RepID=UPI003A8D5FAB